MTTPEGKTYVTIARRAFDGALLALLLLAAPGIRSVFASYPQRITLANITSANGTITWVSEAAEAGSVEMAESAADLRTHSNTFRVAIDVRGAVTDITHFVALGDSSEFDARPAFAKALRASSRTPSTLTQSSPVPCGSTTSVAFR